MRRCYLKISRRVSEKLTNKHNVKRQEIEECFMNRCAGLLEDTRLNNKTTPPTFWFIAETDVGRTLKVVFMALEDGCYEIKTAYSPNENEVEIYERHA